MTAADRPSVTDNARAEAERHYPALNADDETLTYPRSAVREHARGGFVKGYEAGWAAGRAETTTATTEDAETLAATYLEGYVLSLDAAREHGRAITKSLADAGLLATARTVNVHPTYTVEYQQKIADELGVEREAVLRALGLAAPLLATARTRPTRADIAAQALEDAANLLRPDYPDAVRALNRRAVRIRGGGDR